MDMGKGIPDTTGNVRTKQFYHGTRTELKAGDLIRPNNLPNVGEQDKKASYVYLTSNLDGAIWESELADGEGPGRVYIVESTGPIQDVSNLAD